MSRAAQAVSTADDIRSMPSPRFDAVRCKQCGLCAHVCPAGALAPPKRSTPTLQDDEACNGCRTCEYICPDFAIKMVAPPSEDGDPPSSSEGPRPRLREAGR